MNDLSSTEPGEVIPAAKITPRPKQTPGEMLQQARDQLNVSIKDLAREVNLPVSKLQALENDDYQEMTAPTFVKGYIRSCSRFLQLDATEVIAAYEQYAQHLADTGVVVEPPAIKSQPLEKPIPEWSWAVLAGGVVVVLMAVFFLWGSGDDTAEPAAVTQAPAASSEDAATNQPSNPSDNTTEDTQPVPVNSTEAITPAVAVPQANEQEEAQAAAEQRAQLASELKAAAAEQAQQAKPQTAPTAAPEPVPSPVVTGNQPRDELAFYFSGDCWIEIYDGSGQRLHQGLSRTGDTLTVVGDAPFSIMLGNAWVASLQHNGVTVAIEPRPGRNTLRLTVGDEL